MAFNLPCCLRDLRHSACSDTSRKRLWWLSASPHKQAAYTAGQIMEIDFPSLAVIAGTGCHARHGAAGVFPQVDSVLEPQPRAYPRRPSRMANMSQHGRDDAASTSGRPLPYLDEARYITPTPRLSATLLHPQRRVSPRYTLLLSVKARHADWPPRLGSCFPPDEDELQLCGRVGPRVPCRLGPPRLNITSWVKGPAKQGLSSRTSIRFRAPIDRLAEGEVVVMRLFLIS